MTYEDPDPIQRGDILVGCLLWIIGFLMIAGVILAAMAFIRP
jgi:hypothetical protein